MAEHVISVPNIATLRGQTGGVANIVLTLGATTPADGFGKFYMYDSTDSTTVEDTVNYNTIVPVGGIGRWKAIFIRSLSLPHGTLKIDGAVKTFYGSGSTAADGTYTLYLTLDGLATGPAIFSEVWYDDSKASVNAATPNDAVSSCRKTLSTDNKTLVHLFFRGASTTVSILGAIAVGFRSAITATPVLFMVSGK